MMCPKSVLQSTVCPESLSCVPLASIVRVEIRVSILLVVLVHSFMALLLLLRLRRSYISKAQGDFTENYEIGPQILRHYCLGLHRAQSILFRIAIGYR